MCECECGYCAPCGVFVCQGQRAVLHAYKCLGPARTACGSALCWEGQRRSEREREKVSRFVSARAGSCCTRAKKLSCSSKSLPSCHSDWGPVSKTLSKSNLKLERKWGERQVNPVQTGLHRPGCICMCLRLVVFDLHSRFRQRSASRRRDSTPKSMPTAGAISMPPATPANPLAA